jgi:TetR/AcrR family transcriptional regulator
VSSRRDDILQALARMLESSAEGRITTAALAREVGVSEAALYRHFPSKAKMYEGLLAFAEETIFSAVNQISTDQMSAEKACSTVLLVVLTFCERNPGITRLLCGDALHGEKARLQIRAGQLFDRLESELRQIIRHSEVTDNLKTTLPPGMASALMVDLIEGRLRRFLRTQYKMLPTHDWSVAWPRFSLAIFPT